MARTSEGHSPQSELHAALTATHQGKTHADSGFQPRLLLQQDPPAPSPASPPAMAYPVPFAPPASPSAPAPAPAPAQASDPAYGWPYDHDDTRFAHQRLGRSYQLRVRTDLPRDEGKNEGTRQASAKQSTRQEQLKARQSTASKRKITRVCKRCGVLEPLQDETDECCWRELGMSCIFPGDEPAKLQSGFQPRQCTARQAPSPASPPAMASPVPFAPPASPSAPAAAPAQASDPAYGWPYDHDEISFAHQRLCRSYQLRVRADPPRDEGKSEGKSEWKSESESERERAASSQFQASSQFWCPRRGNFFHVDVP